MDVSFAFVEDVTFFFFFFSISRSRKLMSECVKEIELVSVGGDRL